MDKHENIKYILSTIDIIGYLLSLYQLIIKKEFTFGIMLSIASLLLTLYLWCANNLKKAREYFSIFTAEKIHRMFLMISIFYLVVSICCLLYSYFTDNTWNILKSLYIPEAIYSLTVILIKLLADINEGCVIIYACTSFIPLVVLSVITFIYDSLNLWYIITNIIVIGIVLVPILFVVYIVFLFCERDFNK